MKVIIVGLGNQGKKRRQVAGADVVATVDPFNKDADYKNYKEVPPEKYDSVLVCTPDETKFEILSYFLSNKKNILVEKPLLASRTEDLEKLLGLAESNKTTCYTAYNHRFEPHLMRMREHVQNKTIGKIYSVRIFYGNGTARDVRNSEWRDQGLGIFTDLGSHLFDIIHHVFDDIPKDFVPLRFNNFENKSYDHIHLASWGSPQFVLEATMLSWKNTFNFDVVGEKGSLHINRLCKWGPSTFSHRQRVLPSGRPPEKSITLEQSDPTWQAEYEYFKILCQSRGNNLRNDIIYNELFNHIQRQLP